MMNKITEYTVQVAEEKTQWFLNGKLHRHDGPAVEYANGNKAWFLNSKLHRTDGPAVEYNNGDKSWYLDGKYHRTDGPAIEYSNGDKSWFLNGEKVTEQAVMKPVKKITVAEIEALLGYPIKIIAG
jgi:hypothetical protein